MVWYVSYIECRNFYAIGLYEHYLMPWSHLHINLSRKRHARQIVEKEQDIDLYQPHRPCNSHIDPITATKKPHSTHFRKKNVCGSSGMGFYVKVWLAYAVKVIRHTPWSRVRCHGSHECWFTHSQFHSRRHSLCITLKYTTLVCMRSSNAWTMKSWQRS